MRTERSAHCLWLLQAFQFWQRSESQRYIPLQAARNLQKDAQWGILYKFISQRHRKPEQQWKVGNRAEYSEVGTVTVKQGSYQDGVMSFMKSS